jgi:hypothetical protein
MLRGFDVSWIPRTICAMEKLDAFECHITGLDRRQHILSLHKGICRNSKEQMPVRPPQNIPDALDISTKCPLPWHDSVHIPSMPDNITGFLTPGSPRPAAMATTDVLPTCVLRTVRVPREVYLVCSPDYQLSEYSENSALRLFYFMAVITTN